MIKRVLVVDDHEPWRQYVRSLLHSIPGWQVCGEADDADVGIEQAALAPDLILMDVELPSRNGIDAAKAIFAADPQAKLLFISAHRSWDIVDAALSTGARGYLVKTSAVHELVPAMETIVAGGRFISAVLTGRRVDRIGTGASHRERCHVAGFYAEDTPLVDQYTRFIGDALDGGSAVVFIAADARRHDVYRALQARAVDVDLAIRDGRLLPVDPAPMLASMMVDGWPDEGRFWRNGHSLFSRGRRASSAAHPRVAVCGDGAGILAQSGQADAAIRLEQLWDEFARTYNVDILCGYSASLQSTVTTEIVNRISGTHSAAHWP